MPETIGNITRPPSLSVSAPTTIRPREPTMTGTATISATSDSLSVPSVPCSRKSGPSGLIRAQAQKFTANPIVAIASISHGERVTCCDRRSSSSLVGHDAPPAENTDATTMAHVAVVANGVLHDCQPAFRLSRSRQTSGPRSR